MGLELFRTAAPASFQLLQDGTLDREGVVGPAADQKAGIGEGKVPGGLRAGEEEYQPIARRDPLHLCWITGVPERDDARGDEIGFFLIEHLPRIENRDPAPD